MTENVGGAFERYCAGYVAAGSWEPVPQRLRMGAAPSDWRARAAEELDEEWIRFLADHGVTHLFTVYSKGFGPKTEEPVRQCGREMLRLAHKHGMAAVAYLSDTVIMETFSLEEPDVANWLQVNDRGGAVFYGGDQTHRRRGCFNNPKWRAYLTGMIRRAFNDGFDATQPDNDIWWPEPDSCRCEHCRSGFRAFVKARYPTPDASMDRFGLPTLEAVEPPLYGHWFRPSDLDAIRNPMIQEWIRFRCRSIADFRKHLGEFVRAECPGMSLLLPSSGVTTRNMAWLHGDDHDLTVGLLPLWTTEEPLPCVYDAERDALGSKVRSMRLARRCGAIMCHNAYIAHEGPAKPEAMLAEGLAFNQGALGGVAAFHWGSRHWPEYNDRYIAFLRENRTLLTHVEGVAEVAVLHSSATLAFDGLAARSRVIAMEQLLAQNNVIFEPILDRHLDDLGRYRILVLPGVTCMSDEEARRIADWVAAGGALLATDGASSKDAWRRPRPFPALAEVFGWAANRDGLAQSGEGIDFRMKDGPQKGHGFRRHGRGAAAYIPRIEFDWGQPDPDNRDYRAYPWNRWTLPANGAEILSTLHRLGYNQLSTTFPRWVVCELMRPRNAPGLALHAVNYRKGQPVGAAALSLRVPDDWQEVNVAALSPEWSGPRAADVTFSGTRADIIAPGFDTYCLFHVTPRNATGRDRKPDVSR